VVARVAERRCLLPHRAQLPLRARVGHVAAVIGVGTAIGPGVEPAPLPVGRRGHRADDPRRAVASAVGVERSENQGGVGVAAGLHMLQARGGARIAGIIEARFLIQVKELHLATGARHLEL